MRKKNEAGEINLPDFRLYYKATVIKTVWYWHKNIITNQWNKTETPEINTHTPMGTLFLTKEADYTMEKSLFKKWCWLFIIARTWR